MGACIQPTPAMTPWYNVEVSSGHAELTATTFLQGWYRIREAGRATDHRAVEFIAEYTDEELAAAWITYGPATYATPKAPLTALLAALQQIADHHAYRRWQTHGPEGAPDPLIRNEVHAELRDDGRLLLTGPFIRLQGDKDGDHLHALELLYMDVAPLLEAVGALA